MFIRFLKNIFLRLLKQCGYKLTLDQTEQKRASDLRKYEKLYSADALRERRFYNVGSGRFHHTYWTNLDFESEWYGAVQKNIIKFDLMAKGPLPIASESAEVIYTSHTVEHVTDDAVRVFFSEVYRSLKKGGFFRVTTGPDAATDYAAMMNGDDDWFYWDYGYEKPGAYEHNFRKPATSVPLEERWLHHVATPLAPNDVTDGKKIGGDELKKLIATMPRDQLLDYLTSQVQYDPKRPGAHISWWTHEKLESFLRAAGFSVIYRSGYGQSLCPILRNVDYFDNTHPQMSIYMEARK